MKSVLAKADYSDSDDTSSSEDETPKPVITATEKAAPKASHVVSKKADTSSGTSESDSDSESDEEPAKPAKTTHVAVKSAAPSSSIEEGSDDSSSEDEAPKKVAAITKDSSNDSDDSDSDSDSDVEMAPPSAPVASGKGMSIPSLYISPFSSSFIHQGTSGKLKTTRTPPKRSSLPMAKPLPPIILPKKSRVSLSEVYHGMLTTTG